jgi:hypothetical protein
LQVSKLCLDFQSASLAPHFGLPVAGRQESCAFKINVCGATTMLIVDRLNRPADDNHSKTERSTDRFDYDCLFKIALS